MQEFIQVIVVHFVLYTVETLISHLKKIFINLMLNFMNGMDLDSK